MFHDKKLVTKQFDLSNAAFELHAQACKLAALVDWYERQGYRILPYASLRRHQFTRTEWSYATKGTRPKLNGKLTDKRPARDGLEYYGRVTPVMVCDEETKEQSTYWVIGEVNAEAMQAVNDERFKAREAMREAAEQQAQDNPEISPEVAELFEKVDAILGTSTADELAGTDKLAEPSAPKKAAMNRQELWDQGVEFGYALGYEEGHEAGCLKTTSPSNKLEGAGLEHPADLQNLAVVLNATARLEAENKRLLKEKRTLVSIVRGQEAATDDWSWE